MSVQYATMGPRIEIAAITRCEVVELDRFARLAFGPKIWPEGWRYIPPGVEAAVRITWRTAKGESTCTIGATDAAGLAAAIGEARARSNATTGVRVELDDARSLDAPRELEEAMVEATSSHDTRRS